MRLIEKADKRFGNSTIGNLHAIHLGLGGMTLSEHHVYDPVGKALYLGDGRTVRGEAPPPAIHRVVGAAVSGCDTVPDQGTTTYTWDIFRNLRRVQLPGPSCTISCTARWTLCPRTRCKGLPPAGGGRAHGPSRS